MQPKIKFVHRGTCWYTETPDLFDFGFTVRVRNELTSIRDASFRRVSNPIFVNRISCIMSYLLLRSCYFIRWRFGVPLWDKFSARDPRRNNNQRDILDTLNLHVTNQRFSQAKND